MDDAIEKKQVTGIFEKKMIDSIKYPLIAGMWKILTDNEKGAHKNLYYIGKMKPLEERQQVKHDGIPGVAVIARHIDPKGNEINFHRAFVFDPNADDGIAMVPGIDDRGRVGVIFNGPGPVEDRIILSSYAVGYAGENKKNTGALLCLCWKWPRHPTQHKIFPKQRTQVHWYNCYGCHQNGHRIPTDGFVKSGDTEGLSQMFGFQNFTAQSQTLLEQAQQNRETRQRIEKLKNQDAKMKEVLQSPEQHIFGTGAFRDYFLELVGTH